MHTIRCCMAKNCYLPFNGNRGKPLTERELKALWLYERNDTVDKIAWRLESTAHTINTDLKLARQKLGCCSTLAACKKTERLGLYKLLSEAKNPIYRVSFPAR